MMSGRLLASPVTRALLGAAALLALTAGPAGAAEVTTRNVCNGAPGGPTCFDLTAFRAGPGEENRVTVVVGADTLVRDDGAPLTAGEGCTQVDERTARCRAGQTSIRTFDGDDEVAASGSTGAVQVVLGPGNDRSQGAWRTEGEDGDDRLAGQDPAPGFATTEDTLDGGPGDDVLLGLGGGDRLIPGPGADSAEGGAGDDVIVATDGRVATGAVWELATPVPDRLDGGAGTDDLVYDGEERGVAIDLANASAGGSGAAGDSLGGFENVTVAAGANDIAGDDGPNRITTGAGRDRVVGRGGDDEISGGRGVDTLLGGDGDDSLTSAGEGASVFGGPGDDRLTGPVNGLADGGPGDDDIALPRRGGVRCGAGADILRGAGRPRPRGDCERAQAGTGELTATFGLRLRLRSGRATLPYSSTAPEGIADRASWRISVRDDRTGRSLSSDLILSVYDRPRTIRFPLSRADQRRVRRGGLRVVLTARLVSESDASGASGRLAVRTVLRR